MATDANPAQALTVGEALLEALCARAFDRVEGILAPDIRMRTLLPSGHHDYAGAGEATAAFTDWFGGADDFEVVQAGANEVAEARLHLSYRFRLRRPRAVHTEVVEQHAFCKVLDGRIVTIDLVCSGFRPAPENAGVVQ